MSYPRNAADPPEIGLGSLFQISDNSLVAADALVTVKPDGAAEAAGEGTLTYLSTSGAWVYAPTQAETDYSSFVVTLYKSGCTRNSVTVPTTPHTDTYPQVDIQKFLGGTPSTVDDSNPVPATLVATGLNSVIKLWNWLAAIMGKTADAATLSEINATTAGASYNNTTDSQEAQAAALTAVGGNVALILADTGTDGVVLSEATMQSIADEVLKRAVTNVEDDADKHSLAAVVMISTNSEISEGVLTAKKPSDDSTFFTYIVTSDSSADNLTGIS